MQLATTQQIISMSPAQREQLRIIEKAALVSYFASAALTVTGATIIGAFTRHIQTGFITGSSIALCGLAGGLVNNAPLHYDREAMGAAKICGIILDGSNGKPLTKAQCIVEGIKIGAWKNPVPSQALLGSFCIAYALGCCLMDLLKRKAGPARPATSKPLAQNAPTRS